MVVVLSSVYSTTVWSQADHRFCGNFMLVLMILFLISTATMLRSTFSSMAVRKIEPKSSVLFANISSLTPSRNLQVMWLRSVSIMVMRIRGVRSCLRSLQSLLDVRVHFLSSSRILLAIMSSVSEAETHALGFNANLKQNDCWTLLVQEIIHTLSRS